ncbi:hypothetical protein ACWD1Z_05865 [Streptomyces sp. NPDC002784]
MRSTARPATVATGTSPLLGRVPIRVEGEHPRLWRHVRIKELPVQGY